jgi:hypothetical protein
LGSFGISTSVVALGPARIETVSPAVTAERQRSVNHALGTTPVSQCVSARMLEDGAKVAHKCVMMAHKCVTMRHSCAMRRIDGLAP